MKPNEHGVFMDVLPRINLAGKQWSVQIAAVCWRGRWVHGFDVRYGRCQVGSGGFHHPVSANHETYPDLGSALGEARRVIIAHLKHDRMTERSVAKAIDKARAALERAKIYQQALLPGMGE